MPSVPAAPVKPQPSRSRSRAQPRRPFANPAPPRSAGFPTGFARPVKTEGPFSLDASAQPPFKSFHQCHMCAGRNKPEQLGTPNNHVPVLDFGRAVTPSLACPPSPESAARIEFFSRSRFSPFPVKCLVLPPQKKWVQRHPGAGGWHHFLSRPRPLLLLLKPHGV
jgi:hypothetical protein